MKKRWFSLICLSLLLVFCLTSCGPRYVKGSYSAKVADLEITMTFKEDGTLTQEVISSSNTKTYSGTYYIKRDKLVITLFDGSKSNTVEYVNFVESEDSTGVYVEFGGYKYYQVKE